MPTLLGRRVIYRTLREQWDREARTCWGARCGFFMSANPRPMRRELCVVIDESLSPLNHPRDRRRALNNVRIGAILNMQRITRE